MMKFLKKALLYFILPVAAIIAGYRFHWIAGTALLFAYVGYIFYANLPSVYTVIGQIKYNKGTMEEAIKWFGKAYETGRARPQLGISYGYLMLKNAQVDESEKVFNEILKTKLSEDDKMLVKSNIALVLWKKGKLDEAVELLETVYKDFKTTNLYGSLGYLLILKGDLDRALQFNLEAYEYNNSNSIILDNLGETYYHRCEYDKAEEIYEKLMENKPSFPEAYYHYALVLTKKENYQKALEMIRKALTFTTTFLSSVSREEIEKKAEEIEKYVNK